ncbi:MAG: c-type cytochrome [Pseudomonadota bacterium]
MKATLSRFWLATLTAAALTACSGKDDVGNISQATSASLTPSNEQLAAVYNRSCRTCHTIAGTGAPLTGDEAAWAPLLAKGMDTLVDNVVNGVGGMPPLGLCMDCDAAQFEDLIRFMATGN